MARSPEPRCGRHCSGGFSEMLATTALVAGAGETAAASVVAVGIAAGISFGTRSGGGVSPEAPAFSCARSSTGQSDEFLPRMLQVRALPCAPFPPMPAPSSTGATHAHPGPTRGLPASPTVSRQPSRGPDDAGSRFTPAWCRRLCSPLIKLLAACFGIPSAFLISGAASTHSIHFQE